MLSAHRPGLQNLLLRVDNTAMNGILSRILRVGVATAALTGVLAGPAAADDDDDDKTKHEPVLVKEQTATVMAGTSTWVNVLWVADGDIDDFVVIAEEKKEYYEVAYSATTVDHAGPMNGYSLSDFESDFTALQITIPDDYKKKEVKLELRTTWTRPDGEQDDKKFSIKIPVAHYDGGRDWQLVDDQAPLGSGWIEMPVVGLAPTSGDLQFRLDDSETVEVYLPQGDWTGPHHNAALDIGESDVLRFFVEPGTLTADHKFSFTATWTSGGEAKSEPVSFAVLAG